MAPPNAGARWPEEFITLAEESGAIGALGSYVLLTAAQDVCAWNAEHAPESGVFLSVNVSPMQLQQQDFLAEVERVLATTGLPAAQLVLEITESAMFRDSQATIAKLQAIRDFGVRIAIDDFGTGYASLTYLRRFPVDVIKIAQEFVGRDDVNAQEWAFTGAILALGQRLGVAVIAEGIEDRGQVDRLLSLGCPLGQGYLFARPAALADVADATPVVPGPEMAFATEQAPS